MSVKRIFFFLTVSFFTTFSALSSAPAIVLKDTLHEVILGPGNYEYFEDKSAKISFAEITSGKFQDGFRLNQLDYNYNENPSSAYWLRFKIKIESPEKVKWVLDGQAQQTQFVEVYVPDAKGEYSVVKLGSGIDFPMREYKVRNLTTDLPSEPSEYTVYIRIFAKNHSGFLYNIRSQHFFTAYHVSEYYLSGIYYGILLIMAIYNLLLFVSIRERVYLYYVLYVSACILSAFSEDGLGFQYMWPFHPTWNIPIDYYVAPIFFLLSFVVYSVSFLQLRKKFVTAYRIQVLVTGVYLLYFVLQVSAPEYIPYVAGIYTLPFVSIYLITVYTIFRGYQPARYFIVGYTFILLSLIINQLRIVAAIESNIFTVYSFNFGIILEIVTLSFALAERFRILKKESEEAQSKIIHELKGKEIYKNALIKQLQENEQLKDRVNKELEAKVKERTYDLEQKSGELEETNKKLQLAMSELSKMNMELDVDNWGLKKKVTEETKLRILAEEVSYEEFLKIFPDDTSCFRYLEEIKWGKGYHCRKCGHEKYSDSKTFSRKCTRCGHVESVTAATLFHSIKFPINKAFYIVYLSTSKKKITVDELSVILTLRKNTCWAFRKKVYERKEILEKKKGKEIAKWEVLFIDQ